MDNALSEVFKHVVFTCGIQPNVPWHQSVFPDELYIQLDCFSQLQQELTVLDRLIHILGYSKNVKVTKHYSVVTLPRSEPIYFMYSHELLCKLSVTETTLTPYRVATALFTLNEFVTLDFLVKSFPTIQLDILVAVDGSFVDSLEDVEEGRSCTVVSRILGKPKPLLFWCFNAEEAENKCVSFEVKGILYEASLMIPDVGQMDVGEYYCCILPEDAWGIALWSPAKSLRLSTTPATSITGISPMQRLKNVSSRSDCSKLPLHSEPAKAIRKVALLVGNSHFDHYDSLYDSTAILSSLAYTLSNMNYEVLSLTDLRYDEFTKVVRLYESYLRPGVYGFFYLSSHGVRIGTEDFILCVDTLKDIYTHGVGATASQSAHGLIKVEALTCRLQARNSSLNCMVLDVCRSPLYVESQQERRHETHDPSAVLAQINHYRKTNLYRLFACPPGGVTADCGVSVLAVCLRTCLEQRRDDPACEVLKAVLQRYRTLTDIILSNLKRTKGRASVEDIENMLLASPELELPPLDSGSERTSYSDLWVLAGNHDPAVSGLPRNQDSVHRVPAKQRRFSDSLTTSDSTTATETECVVSTSPSNSLYSLTPQLELWRGRTDLVFGEMTGNRKAKPWLEVSTPTHNVVTLSVRCQSNEIPKGYIKLSEVREAWKPCRVVAKLPLDLPCCPPDHFTEVTIHDLQRLPVEMAGAVRKRIKLHRVCSGSMDVPFHSSRGCRCEVINLWIDCPHLVRLWYDL